MNPITFTLLVLRAFTDAVQEAVEAAISEQQTFSASAPVVEWTEITMRMWK